MKKKVLIILTFGVFLSLSGYSQDSFFAPSITQAKNVTDTYQEICKEYYSSLDKLLRVELDTRPDGTPNIVFDPYSLSAQFVLRLSVNDSEYNKWKKRTIKKLKNLNLNNKFSNFEKPKSVIIAGEEFKFGNNEYKAVERVISNHNFPDLSGYQVKVEFLDKCGNVVIEKHCLLSHFKRSCDHYPLPLSHLNRLNDFMPKEKCGVIEDAKKEFRIDLLKEETSRKITQVVCSIQPSLSIKKGNDFGMLSRPPHSSVNNIYTNQIKLSEERISKIISQLVLNMVQMPEKDYFMCKYEVTQELWIAIMEYNPARFVADNRPVERVSWDKCVQFVEKLNKNEQVKNSGFVFRLPTEEEWEYACKAGSNGDFGFVSEGVVGTLDEMGWCKETSATGSQPVGMKKPNMWGLYDMHGNVWEWTSTREGYLPVRRGGSWYNGSDGCFVSTRHSDPSSFSDDTLGFRLAATKVVQPQE